jgi:hypothetical protein
VLRKAAGISTEAGDNFVEKAVPEAMPGTAALGLPHFAQKIGNFSK